MEETFRNYFNFGTEQSYTSTSPIDHTLMGRERNVPKGEQMEFPVYHFHEDGTITLSSTEYPGRFVYVQEDFDYETEVVRWKEDCDFRQGQYDEYHEQKQTIDAIKNSDQILASMTEQTNDMLPGQATDKFGALFQEYQEFIRKWIKDTPVMY